METRKVTIISNKTGCTNTIQTSATTLGELKSDMKDKGISYEDCLFTEGISQTKLISDDSVLPTNLTFKGKTTNNLVMLLTVAVDKIRSGNNTRKTIYNYIELLDLKKK